jgi:hypothetical protein
MELYPRAQRPVFGANARYRTDRLAIFSQLVEHAPAAVTFVDRPQHDIALGRNGDVLRQQPPVVPKYLSDLLSKRLIDFFVVVGREQVAHRNDDTL